MVTRLVTDQTSLKAAKGAAKEAEKSLTKEELRKYKVVVDVPGEMVESSVYRGFEIQVHHLTGIPTYCFRPTILLDHKVVHEIHVRSAKFEVSRDHYAKKAIDYFLKQGAWPIKLGIPLRS